MKLKYLLGSVVAASASIASAAFAETVLRLDEVAVGELDPAKASDYADSILMFNVYDTLVLPNQGGPGHSGDRGDSRSSDGATGTPGPRAGGSGRAARCWGVCRGARRCCKSRVHLSRLHGAWKCCK